MKINFKNKISRNINVDNQATSFFSLTAAKVAIILVFSN